MRKVSFTLRCTYATALLACAPQQDLAVESDQSEEISKPDNLTSVEWTTYTDDLKYMHSITKSGVPVHINFADPRQYNLVMTRLKLTGKNTGNSPYLFELIEARRQQHLALKLKPGTFAHDVTAYSLTEPSADPQHYIEEGRLTKVNSLQAEVVGAASSTFPGGTAYTRIDVGGTTTGGLAVTPVVAREEYVNPEGNVGANVTVSSSGKVSLSSAKAYFMNSLKYEELLDGQFSSTFVRTQFGATNTTLSTTPPTLSPVSITAPLPTVLPPNDLISVCMNRSWTTDCDVIVPTPPNSSYWPVQMPLAGSVTITSAHVFDQQWLDDIKWALNQTPPVEPNVDVGSLKLVLTNVGGGCDVTDGNTLTAKIVQFWNRVSLSADKKTFSWDLTGLNAAFFDDRCAQIQNTAKLTARIPLRMHTVAPATYKSSDTSLTITSDPAVMRPDYLMERITLTNSCLAEGTRIELSDGKLAAIETLRIGQKVFSPYDREDHALLVTDTAKGSERAPMVRIRDEKGSTLLLTEMHPIATPDRGMVQAKHLRTGDVVMTKRGPSELTEVSREPYNGRVYNLKVGSETEMASLGPDQTVVYANGFVVGDGQIQSKYEALSIQQENSRTVEQIPERWRRDYLLSGQK